MRILVALLLSLTSSAASATSLACAIPGYPKEFPDPIQYDVDKGFQKFASPTDAPNRIDYIILLAPVFDKKPLEDAFVEILDGDIVSLRVPLRYRETHVEAWHGKYAAFLHAKPSSYRIRIVAVYGGLCSATLRQVVEP